MAEENVRGANITIPELKNVGDAVWEIPADYKEGMRVTARVFGTENIVKAMDAGVYDQVTNVACLPGIQKHAFCMPDGHWGYGFPIGGVAAFDLEEGVISPGGIGFDINCGMRLITTSLTYDEVKPRLKELVDTFFRTVPAGVGAKGFVNANRAQFREVAETGVKWCVENGYGWQEDLKRVEEYGMIKGADTRHVSEKAITRGVNQMGTLGSGNHYLEIQRVMPGSIHEPEIAKQFGIFENQIVVMLHCGSRGFGHQIATDYLMIFEEVMRRHNMRIKDKELACAPYSTQEARNYYAAMACAANMAFANRQVIVHRIREGFSKVFRKPAEDMGLNIVYDVAHNIAKIEEHTVDGKRKKVIVHRKGSTRSFGPGHEELAPIFQKSGQPVIIGGSMETGSYLLVGTKKAEETTFGSTAHGSGRTMSRTKAKHIVRGDRLQNDMEKRGIYVKAVSMAGLAEEAGLAYKNINEVVESVAIAGLSKPVVGLKPIGNVKG